jgi:hypothetical protein
VMSSLILLTLDSALCGSTLGLILPGTKPFFAYQADTTMERNQPFLIPLLKLCRTLRVPPQGREPRGSALPSSNSGALGNPRFCKWGEVGRRTPGRCPPAAGRRVIWSADPLQRLALLARGEPSPL